MMLSQFRDLSTVLGIDLHLADAQRGYEKAHKASNIIKAIKTMKIVPRMDLRVKLSDGGAYSFCSRLNGAPLTASTNRKSFTNHFYQT
jgi:hypothetical protein